MDAACAAAMSDPDRNPHFRRRWDQRTALPSAVPALRPPDRTLGTLGLALLAAWRRQQQRGGGDLVRAASQQLDDVAHTGDPREVV